ncbi:MAG: amidohydrolase family protein [Lentisphaeraceae bacterium]|nr:amidohydrolase family protein [Lentisphaeraceae bacterium]
MDRRAFNTGLIGSLPLFKGCNSYFSSGTIDSHAHIWPSFGEYPFKKGIKKEDLSPSSFTAEDLIRAGEPSGVERFVLIQHIYYHGYDYSYFKKVSAQYPGKFAIVGAIHQDYPALEKKVEQDSKTNVSGYRIPSAVGESWLEGKNMERFWQIAADFDQSICLLRNKNVSLKSVYEKCRKFPQTRVVIDHYGHVDLNNKEELNTLWRLSQLENVYLKVSKYYGNGAMTPPYLDMLPLLEQVVKRFGSEKLMWASDCPYQLEDGHTYKAAYELVAEKASFLSTTDKQNIFRDTAARVFFKV